MEDRGCILAIAFEIKSVAAICVSAHHTTQLSVYATITPGDGSAAGCWLCVVKQFFFAPLGVSE